MVNSPQWHLEGQPCLINDETQWGWLHALQAEEVYNRRVAGRNPADTLWIAGSEETLRKGEDDYRVRRKPRESLSRKESREVAAKSPLVE